MNINEELPPIAMDVDLNIEKQIPEKNIKDILNDLLKITNVGKIKKLKKENKRTGKITDSNLKNDLKVTKHKYLDVSNLQLKKRKFSARNKII